MRANEISHLPSGNSGNAIDQRAYVRELKIDFCLLDSSLVRLDSRFGRQVRLYVVIELALSNCLLFRERSISLYVELGFPELRFRLRQLPSLGQVLPGKDADRF